jgi:superfamily II DNA or RNA helicase
MSIIIEIDKLPYEVREQISKDLELKIENKFGVGAPRYIYPYTVSDNTIKIPFAYAVGNLKLGRLPRTHFTARNVIFNGVLRPEQQIVRKEAISRLSSKGSIIISCYTGFGKTALAIELGSIIGFKTLVIVNKIVLINQWRDSIMKFCSKAKVQCLSPRSIKDPDNDFYIINAQNVEKMGLNYFDDIGLCLVDEVHMIMAESLSKCMQYIYPRYLIGLSATPYRPDGLDKLLELYFGLYKIIRKLWCHHIVYKVDTNFTPPVERNIQGRLNWGAILDAQAQNEERNNLIIDIIRKFSDRNFLVLVKRVIQGEYLLQKLVELGESVTDLIGDKQEFAPDARILIGTCQKVGVGFDHSKMDTLLLATDIEEYFIQYLGRVFRTKDSEPYIFDLVDKNSTLVKHFNTRKDIYKEHGGIIQNYKL